MKRPILELGCGTGKLSVPLANAGFSVTGLENSPALLAAGKGSDVSWVESDMRSFDLGRTFNLIMLPSNDIGHLHTFEEFSGCT